MDEPKVLAKKRHMAPSAARKSTKNDFLALLFFLLATHSILGGALFDYAQARRITLQQRLAQSSVVVDVFVQPILR